MYGFLCTIMNNYSSINSKHLSVALGNLSILRSDLFLFNTNYMVWYWLQWVWWLMNCDWFCTSTLGANPFLLSYKAWQMILPAQCTVYAGSAGKKLLGGREEKATQSFTRSISRWLQLICIAFCMSNSLFYPAPNAHSKALSLHTNVLTTHIESLMTWVLRGCYYLLMQGQ